MLALANWEGVSEPYFLESEMDDLLANTVTKIDILPLDPDQPLEYTIGNTRYRPNVTLEGRIETRYDYGGGVTSTTFFFGKNGDQYQIAGTIEEKI